MLFELIYLNTWLSQKAMARLLGVTQQSVSAHIKKIVSKDESYGKCFVMTMRPNDKEKHCKMKFYHNFILELVAEKVRNACAKELLENLRGAKRTMGARPLFICE